MARKWLQSASVEVSAAGALSVAPAASSFTGDVKKPAAAATPEPLVATSTPCRFVWIGPIIDANGIPQNTKPCFVGESAGQALATKGAIPIMPSNFEGLIVWIDDANKLCVKSGVNGEGVAYRVFT